MSARALVRAPLDTVLHDAVDRGALPQVVAVATDADGVSFEGAAGPRAVGHAQPVEVDSIFRVASMTKIICTVAALQQRDRGTLDFDAPVDAYCPDFAHVQVLDGFDSEGPRLRRPNRRATVRQLLTHTAGLAYSFWSADIVRWAALPSPRDGSNGLPGPLASPMVNDPGVEVTYGISTDWLGRVVEAASGRALDAYLRDEIFAPLGMASTTFRLDDAQRARAVPVHDRDETGHWRPTDIDWDPNPPFWPGGHGLYSTARDFSVFQRMLLDGGSGGGELILHEASVQEMFANQIGTLWFPADMATADPAMTADFRVGPDMKWGWGLLLNTRRQPGMRAVGSGGWAGIFNTYFWIDPRSRVTGALFTQCRPFLAPAVVDVYAAFERAIYSMSA